MNVEEQEKPIGLPLAYGLEPMNWEFVDGNDWHPLGVGRARLDNVAAELYWALCQGTCIKIQLRATNRK